MIWVLCIDDLTFNSISVIADFARYKRYSENSENAILSIVYDYALRSNDMNSFKWCFGYYARPLSSVSKSTVGKNLAQVNRLRACI